MREDLESEAEQGDAPGELDEPRLPDVIVGFGERFHVRNGFTFARAGDFVSIQTPHDSLTVRVNEWAAAVAWLGLADKGGPGQEPD